MILLTGATGTIGRATMTALRTVTLASGVQPVLGRPPRSMREWAARLKTAPGTA
jgi:nucleoside-diphosphate-sugar epimerase